MFSKILVCTDGSSSACKAVEHVAELAKQSRACVLLLHVVTTASGNSGSAETYFVPWQLPHSSETSDHEAFTEAARLLTEAETVFQQEGISCHRLTAHGLPAVEIVQIAKREDVDLIVLGSWGFSPAKSLLLGSVSEGVALHAHCPVLIIR
jgi:nucleotide-binding universal stress UspA family protein